MMSNSKIEIGFSTNLLDGLNPAWDPSNSVTDILYPPKGQAMQGKSVESVENRGEWSYPDITLHDSVISLLDELIPYQVISPASDRDAPEIESGALLIGMPDNQSALEQLSATIGIDLTNPDYAGYALVKLNRLDGQDKHASAAKGILVHARPKNPDPAYGLNEDFKSAMVKLRHGRRARSHTVDDAYNVDSAKKALDFFDSYGTHYVSSVQLGDTILQVFAYRSHKFQKIKEAYSYSENDLNGSGSTSFAQFTTGENGIFGYVADGGYGNIISLSNSEIFQTSLSHGDWYDDLWSEQNSVFSLFNSGATLTLFTLNEQFTEQTVIQTELASLGVMIEYQRRLILQRVFKAAMVQKYCDNIDTNFAIYDQRNFGAMLPQDQPGLVSYLATPTINVYKTRLDISDMQFVSEEEVENFILFSQVLHISGKNQVSIPGGNVKLFGQVLDMRTDDQPKRIKLGDDAFASLEIGCSEFLGALMIENESGEYSVILDGIKFALNGSTVVVDSDVRVVPPAESLPLLVNSLQYSMTFAEAVMSNQVCPQEVPVQGLISDYLNWLPRVIPATETDLELKTLRVRALDLANYVTNPDYGSFVPVLPPENHDNYINDILDFAEKIKTQITDNNKAIAARKQAELTNEIGQTINGNIIATGELITEIIQASVEYQNDLTDFYDDMIKGKEAELSEQQAKLNELRGDLHDAEGDVDNAIEKYKSTLEQWQTIEAIRFGLEVASTLFHLGSMIKVPGSGAKKIKELGETTQKVQKTRNSLDATSGYYNGGNIEEVEENLDQLEGARFGSIPELTWNELEVRFKAVMAETPSGGDNLQAAKAELEEAFSILVLRGKAVTNAESVIHSIERDIFTNQLQNEINEKQAKRLAELIDKFHPEQIEDLDKENIDLMGLSGHLVFIQNQMLTFLAKAFLEKDLALQYKNLQPATLITDFNLLSFYDTKVLQDRTTNDAETELADHQPEITVPIELVTPDIPSSKLKDGKVYNFNIRLDSDEFQQYARVRIVSVVAKIEGVKSTESGLHYLKLAYNGTPFQDRDFDGNPLTFRTPQRSRIYEYKVENDQPNFSDDGESWSKNASQITPFSTWEISLPQNGTYNQDIELASTLKITLTFVLEASFFNLRESIQRKIAKRMAMSLGTAPTALEERQLASAVEAMRAKTVASGSIEDLIQAMYAQGSCTNGWDVVFNMGLEQINASLLDQYQALSNNPSWSNVIHFDDGPYEGGFGSEEYYEYHLLYDYPLLQFTYGDEGASIIQDDSVVLLMRLLPGSYYKHYATKGGEVDIIEEFDLVNGEYLVAFIDIEKARITIEGSGNEALNVQLDLAEGSFELGNHPNFVLTDVQAKNFNQAVQSYFKGNPVVLTLNTLDLSHVPTLDALKPKDCLLKIYESQSERQMLQLFIMTGDRKLPSSSQMQLNNIPEPLPVGSECSMMIRSELVFDEVFPESLQNPGWTLEGVEGDGEHPPWSGIFSSALVSVNLDLRALEEEYTHEDEHGNITQRIKDSYSVTENPVDLSLANSTITIQSDGQLAYDGSQFQTIDYTLTQEVTDFPCLVGNCTTEHDYEYSTELTLDCSATLSLSIDGSGREQTILIKTSGQSVVVKGDLSGDGTCHSDSTENKVQQQIQAQVPSQIANQLQFKFDAISLFALENLLFPEKDYINFESSVVPGDMLVLGNFTKIST